LKPSTVETDQSRPVETVLDRGSERSLRRTLGVDVDVLFVAGQLSERVDVFLYDLGPVADAQVRPHPFLKAGETLDHDRLARLSRCGVNSHR